MQPFVSAVLPESVKVQNPPSTLVLEFPNLTLSEGSGNALVPYSGNEELAGVLSRLQLLAVPFVAAGPGWHPTAVFGQLREQGLVSGAIRTIVWTGPDQAQLGEA
jgi:hypothetical protein